MGKFIFWFYNNLTLVVEVDLDLIIKGPAGSTRFIQVTAPLRENRKYYVNLDNIIYITEYKSEEDDIKSK